MLDRKEHKRILDLELKTQSDDFVKLIMQRAVALIEQEEVYTSQFLKFENGLLVLKFKNNKDLPRKGQYLTAVLLNDEKRSFKNWGDISWGELRNKHQNCFSECVCVWHRAYDDKGFQLAGFKGVSVEFASKLVEKCLITLGPHEPPLKYLQNLIEVVSNTPTDSQAARFLDFHVSKNEWVPTIIDEKRNLPDFIQQQLSLSDEIIIQGPPGTGKTFLMAELIAKLLNQNKSILATSLTNRSLIELASKPFLKSFIESGKILKTNLTKDEEEELPGILHSKQVTVISGALQLSTFYISSDFAKIIAGEPPFDYVIVDEASQALLAMLAAVKNLGKKIIFIGDPFQLAPVFSLNRDKLNKENAIYYLEGFNTICTSLSIPSFQLTETYRLSARAAQYTGIFYRNTLISKSNMSLRYQFPECGQEFNKYLHPDGGPVLIKTDLPIGVDNPDFGLFLIIDLLRHLQLVEERYFEIAVVAKKKKTVRSIQKAVTHAFGSDDRLLIETVERVQGLTCDVLIFFIPNASVGFSLQRSLFNVATSRARRHTVLITDKSILMNNSMDRSVKEFLLKLEDEFSFFIEPKQKPRLLNS